MAMRLHTAKAGALWMLWMLLGAADAQTGTLRLTLRGEGRFSRHMVSMQCDAAAIRLGLPAHFRAVYLNGRATSVAVVPVGGVDLVFNNVISASGARYTARDLTWWTKGNTADVYREGDENAAAGHCTEAPATASR